MRVVLQRVKKASVKENGKIKEKIGRGLLLYLAIAEYDNDEDAELLVEKIAKVRIFPEKGKKHDFQKSVEDIDGEVLIIPNYTLYADLSQGNRPYFGEAASPEEAEPLYGGFVELLNEKVGESVKVKSATFGKFIEVTAVNNGPATLVLETVLLGEEDFGGGNGNGHIYDDYADDFDGFLEKLGIEDLGI